jgi:hypothetical protein
MKKINLGKITSIKEITGLKLSNRSSLEGNGGRLGLSQVINTLSGYGEKDGYLVETDKHKWHLLIDNSQSCCEDWGYLWSDDNLENYIGKELMSVKITDMALNTKMIEKEKDIYEGAIKFVDFNFSDGGVLQFAVYNSHNGYYGHDILIAKDKKILLSDVL